MKKLTLALFACIFYLSLAAQYTWTPKACLPGISRDGHGSFSLGNKGYIVCGMSQVATPIGEVWEYNLANNSWAQKNNFPGIARVGPFSFAIGNYAYAGGGADVYATTFYTDFYKYDPSTDTWTPIAAFPAQGRYFGMSFVINGKAYVGCGKASGLFSDFYCYDPVADTWTQVTSMPGNGRQNGVSCTIGNFGYVGLGYNGSNLSDFYSYDPVQDAWTQLNSFGGQPRYGPGYFTINDTFYVAGGRDPFYDDCWRYEQASDTWTQQESFTCLGPARAGCYGFTISNHGYIFGGGETNGTFFTNLYQFGPVDNTFISQVHVLGNDTAYCGSFSRVLSTGNACTKWSTGATGAQITVNTLGNYWALYPDTCGMVSDTIHITQGVPLANLGNDTTYCGAFSRVLSTGVAGTVWSTGATATQITVTTPGTYWAHISNACGVAKDTIVIAQATAPTVNLGNDTAICSAATFTLNATTAGATYLWQDGSTAPTFVVTQTGRYVVKVTSGGCSTFDTIQVGIGSLPAVTITPPVSIICASDSAQICAPNGFATYNWNSGQSTACIFVRLGGNYYVTVSDQNNCTAESNHVTVVVKPIPSVSISVNGDTLRVYNQSNVQWYLNGVAISGGTNNIYIANQQGEYTVLVMDTDGCSALSSPVVFTGLAELTNTGIEVYCAPGEVKVVLIDEKISAVQYQVIAVDGKIVKTESGKSSSFSFSTQQLSNGIYILALRDSHGMLGTKRFEVIH
ncbi:MAG: type sorting protein [Bacteroidota bacterium]|nr:type sorting protein [Bacteroidota bacterium]